MGFAFSSQIKGVASFGASFYFCGEEDEKNISEQIGINGNFREYKYKETKHKLNFCKDYDDPTYDIFDDKRLDGIVEKIQEEIESYMNIIIKELN